MKIVVNGVVMTNETVINFIANPKRAGSAACERYEAYQACETVGEYFETAEKRHAKADLRWDHDKGFLTVVEE